MSGRHSAWSAAVPGGIDPVGDGLWATDDKRGTLLTGVTEGMGTVQGVQGVDFGWIIDGEHYDTTYDSDRGDMELKNIGHGRRAVDVPHWRYSQDKRRQGQQCGYIFCTGMSWTPW